MWLTPFREVMRQRNTLCSRLLTGAIRISAASGFLRQDLASRASAVMAIRPLGSAAGRVLVIQRPDVSPGCGRLVVLAFLFARVAQAHGRGSDFAAIQGDMLLVTQEIVETRQLLRAVQLSTVGNRVTIGEAFSVCPVGWRVQSTDVRTLYLANPGRVQALYDHGRFGAVVIDASHPRTIACLPHLLAAPPVAEAPVVVVLTPITPVRGIDRGQDLVWLWDPDTVSELQALEGGARFPSTPERHHWIASDPELERCLYDVHQSLSGAARLAAGQSLPPLAGAWHVYHVLRQLAVPLTLLEGASGPGPFQQSVRRELEEIKRSRLEARGDLRVYLDINWHVLLERLDELYDLQAARAECAKFGVLVEAVESHLSSARDHLRVVAPSQRQAQILEDCLAERLQGFNTLVDTGRLAVVHQQLEARLIPEAGSCAAVILGPRTGQFRYLDLFNAKPIHVVAYEYEAAADRATLGAAYAEVGRLTRTDIRSRVLAAISMPADMVCEVGPRCSEAPIEEHRPQSAPVRLFPEVAAEALDIEWFGSAPSTGYDPSTLHQAFEGFQTRRVVEVVDTDGVALRFPYGAMVDLLQPEFQRMTRTQVETLRPGDRIILLSDDRYEALFERLRKALDRRRPLAESARLQLWYVAKRKVLREFGGSKSAVYRAIAHSIGVTEQAARNWFADDEEDEGTQTMAPLDYADFLALARLTGVYSSEHDLRDTFQTIRAERASRRVNGKQLRRALVALASGSDYETAVRNAGVLDTPVDEVLLATEEHEVVATRTI